MKTHLKNKAKRLYHFIINTIRAFIRLLHKVFSWLPLNDTVLFSSIPDFSESSVEVFNQMLKTNEFKHYRFIWFCDNPKIQLKRPNVIVKKRIGNPLSRTLFNLYSESKARFSVYTHELYGNIHNNKQVRVFIEHGSFGIKTGATHGKHGKVQHFDYSTYRIRSRGKDGDKLRICGLPRNDRLFDEPAITKEKLGISSFSKVLVWMPTFKHYHSEGMFRLKRNDYAEEKTADISLQEDNAFFEETEKTLHAHNMLMIIKYHPRQDMKYVISNNTDNIKILTDAELLDGGIPLYSLVGATDALITDFSSIAYDYLLIDRPIGFDITDLEDYIKGGTVAFKNPLDYMPGEKITDVQSFCGFLEKVAAGEDNFAAERKKMLDFVHVHQDNQSAKRVVDLLLEHIC